MRIKMKNPPLDQTEGPGEDELEKNQSQPVLQKEMTSKTTGKSNEGSKSQHQYAGQTAQAEEPMHTADDFEKPTHQEFKTGVTNDQPEEETYPLSDWFQKPTRPPTPDRD
ncbi:hypothetical protein Tco_0026086 [Tanacetum coccineum]